MILGGLQKLTLIDYPGKISCTVFCLGCNFRCPWCYNPELVLPEKIKGQPCISEEEFLKFLESRQGLLEGVCVSGGEPTIHGDLPKFCQKIKKLGFLVKIDTNGSNPKMLKELINKKLIDYVALDIKASLNAQKYNKAVGVKVNLENIKESIKILKQGEIDYEFRTTIVPTLFAKEDIVQITKEISPAKRYCLQNFRPEKTLDPKFEKIKPYPEEYLLEIQKAISSFFEICETRA